MELATLQQYWWLLISVLGAVLVFMHFVPDTATFLRLVPPVLFDQLWRRLLAVDADTDQLRAAVGEL